ncbi:hypothetical protein GCM10007415_25460 [Parapedobacter pyrenivorans]|uniref:Glycolipid-binding domain-containing protein n=1 Tax=Parapedobacter pyrenivorans TaxID=1305674 RepID=A0A917HTN3_9SPHI|nr:putative glycolipid-binding domain-containing protein [Parapedobacter pyrenivorans]GGG90018.1 hypothetical protein GCM10007415_25460 [Parapedobacter pyrenivorans]
MRDITTLWQGKYYNSLEHCIIQLDEEGVKIDSAIVGHLDNQIYSIVYFIDTNQSWEVQHFSINAKINSSPFQVEGRKANGHWSINGSVVNDFSTCTDIDISLTPLSNSFPINRLKLEDGQQAHIDVIYIDVLEQNIAARSQKYSRLSAERYKYENVPNDFEAVITIDKSGLVISYPELFERIAFLQ